MDRGAVLLAFALAVLLSFIVIRVVLRTRRGPDHER
jgi:hypothetical protein